jgi:thiamine biosynthesis lipoprotein
VLGPHDVLPSAGGDIIAGCTRTDTSGWIVGIEDPATALTSCSRSGYSAARWPRPAPQPVATTSSTPPPAPRRGLLAGSVIGPTLTWSDVYATAAIVRGPDAAAWVATLPDHAVVLVDPHGTIRTVTSASSAQPGGTRSDPYLTTGPRRDHP